MFRTSGACHNDMLGMASDTVARFTTLPGLMVVMLREGGWRRLERPIDHRIFENATITDWVLGEPWPGLHFPDWATVYAILQKNVEDGQECIDRLQEVGAPTPTDAEREFHAKVGRAHPLAEHGEIGRGRNRVANSNSKTVGGTTAEYLSRRLLRDAPDIFAALERGEYASVRAAAKAAGLVKDKTPLEQLHHWWGKASAEQREQFIVEIAFRGAEEMAR